MARKVRLSPVSLLAAAAAGGFVFLRYRNQMKRARAAARRGGRIVHTATGPVEYAQKGAGFAFLSIHGAGGGHDQGLAVAEDFLGDGYRIIAPSRFGYLRTPLPKGSSAAAQADAHAALLSALHIPKAIVAGVSAGARSAVELAVRHPEMVAALILAVPGTYSPTSPVAVDPSPSSQFAFRLVNAGADFAWWVMEKIAPSLLVRFAGVHPKVTAEASPAEKARIRRIVKSIAPLSLRFAGIRADSEEELMDLPLERIAAPTLILSARDDLFNTLPAARHAAGRIPGARLVVFDTGGHLMVGRKEEVRAAIGDFLVEAGYPSHGRAGARAAAR